MTTTARIASATITTPAGRRITGHIESNGRVSVWQDGPWAGAGRWDGREVADCPAELGAPGESDAAYDALGAALRDAVGALDGPLYAVDTGSDGYDETVVAADEADALAIVGAHARPGDSLDALRARGWTADRVGE